MAIIAADNRALTGKTLNLYHKNHFHPHRNVLMLFEFSLEPPFHHKSASQIVWHLGDSLQTSNQEERWTEGHKGTSVRCRNSWLEHQITRVRTQTHEWRSTLTFCLPYLDFYYLMENRPSHSKHNNKRKVCEQIPFKSWKCTHTTTKIYFNHAKVVSQMFRNDSFFFCFVGLCLSELWFQELKAISFVKTTVPSSDCKCFESAPTHMNIQ